MSKHRKKTQENYVWLSYSDLATGLMISFILIFIVTNKKTQGYVNDVLKARSAFNKVNKRVVEIITKKKVCDGAIIRQIEDRSETIRISFKDGSKSWFSVNQAKIKKYAERCVKEFGRVWLKQMYLENTQQTVKIQNLIVEGHASSDGEFYHNLSLSQERAFETSKFILQNSSARELGLKRDFSKWSKETLSANGRGESQLVYMPRGKNNKKTRRLCSLVNRPDRKCIEDRDSSKRVEFKYTLTHDYDEYGKVKGN